MQDTPYGFCECGCGEKTALVPYNARSIGWVKGEPKRYIHGHQSRKRKDTQYVVDPETGCWVWQWYVGEKGYGIMRDGNSPRMYQAHRVFYERAVGPIPEGMQLDHLCHTNAADCVSGPSCLHRRCVNPEHLEIVTSRENSVRGKPGGRANPAPRPKPTHCKRGHAYVGDNILEDKTGAWRCRECQKTNMRTYYLRRKARMEAFRR